MKNPYKDKNLISEDRDVLEGYVIKNKEKSNKEIYKIIKKDKIFNNVDNTFLYNEIKETKKIYNLN